jgi:hypothetical protein
MDTSVDGGSSLIRNGTTVCTPPNSEVCGNVCGTTTANSYLTRTGTAAIGYCVCINGAYQCSSINDWPVH